MTDTETHDAENNFASLAGIWAGEVEIAPDFDELPDDIAEAFGVR